MSYTPYFVIMKHEVMQCLTRVAWSQFLWNHLQIPLLQYTQFQVLMYWTEFYFILTTRYSKIHWEALYSIYTTLVTFLIITMFITIEWNLTLCVKHLLFISCPHKIAISQSRFSLYAHTIMKMFPEVKTIKATSSRNVYTESFVIKVWTLYVRTFSLRAVRNVLNRR